MNKPNQQNADGPADTANVSTVSWQTITETMAHPTFTPEQLPALWQQAVEPGDMLAERDRAWNDGIEALYERCETYPQHTNLTVILAGMPAGTWHGATTAITAQVDALLRQATPEQLRQAIEYERQYSDGTWRTHSQIIASATLRQLTGAVIEQLEWRDSYLGYATAPWTRTEGTGRARRIRHIVEQIQQQLLEGSEAAWTVFLGIAGPGTRIGDAAELAVAVELQNRA